jgi:hypothetical protein
VHLDGLDGEGGGGHAVSEKRRLDDGRRSTMSFSYLSHRHTEAPRQVRRRTR